MSNEEFCGRLKKAFGGVVPLPLRDGFAALMRGEKNSIYVPYDFGSWEKLKFGEFLHEDGIGFWDGAFGVEVFEEKE